MNPLGWEHLPAPDLRGRTIIVTGATDGLGREAALQFALWGADLIITARNPGKASRVQRRIVHETGRPGAVEIVEMDLADLDSVREGAAAITARRPEGVDHLVHVAGAITPKRRQTPAGHELMLAVNALAPMLLTELLLPLVRRRIVLVSSDAHKAGRMDLADPHFRRTRWSVAGAYGRSKLALMLYGLNLAEQLRVDLPRSEAGAGGPDLQLAHPGWVLTNFQNVTGSDRLDATITAITRPIAQPAAVGAQSVLMASTQPLPHGSYLGPRGNGALRGLPTFIPRSAAARDPQLAGQVTAWMHEEVGL